MRGRDNEQAHALILSCVKMRATRVVGRNHLKNSLMLKITQLAENPDFKGNHMANGQV